jgi:HSP20 family molecular chaperone IbpA
MPIESYDPWGRLLEIRRTMLGLVAEVLGHGCLERPPDMLQQLFDEMERQLPGGVPRDARAFAPPVDLARSPRRLFIRALVPGVPEDALEIEIEGRTLFIRGVAEEFPPPGAELLNRESNAGYFERSIVLPADADVRGMHAQLDEGVLEIVVPLEGEDDGG